MASDGQVREVSEVHRGRCYVVTRGAPASEGRTHVMKSVRPDAPDPGGAAARLQREFRLLESLRFPGISRPVRLEETDGRPVLVMEDAGPRSLDGWLHRHPLAPKTSLSIAIELAEALARLHARGVIHRDVSPSNIVIDASDHATLIDFDRAASLAGSPQGVATEVQTVTPYTAPEATGRMSRLVDERSDLYALGAIFYELLTGTPPFAKSSPLELLHAQLAEAPVPPSQLNPAVPPLLSNLVLKLLAKMPEARYQSAAVLAADLNEARARLTATGNIEPFELGLGDGAREVPITDQLYQREAERAALTEAVERAARGLRSTVIIRGPAGVGKSMLAATLRPPVEERQGKLLRGKFEVGAGRAPYAALAEALRGLVHGLDTAADREGWRERLRDALGPSAGAFAEISAELFAFLGDAPTLPAVAPTETESRLRFALQALLQVLASEGPVVLLIDDVQWADAASVRLLHFIATVAELSKLMLVLTQRTDEDDGGTIAQLCGDLERAGLPPLLVELGPLGLTGLTAWLKDLFGNEAGVTERFAEIVLRKTGGNPFFVRRFLRHLHELRLLGFDPASAKWRWDIAAIEGVAVTDNVADFLIAALGRLPPDTQELVQAASCLGRRFPLSLLAGAIGREAAEVAAALGPAVREGLVVPIGWHDGPAETRYEFAHDRVQQTAAALVTADRQAQLHLRAGRLLLAQAKPDKLEQDLFPLADHLNFARAAIEDPGERIGLADINRRAGQKAKRASAYGAATAYLQQGIDLLPPDAWQNCHDLAFGLFRDAIECAYASGERERAEALFQRSLAATGSPLEQAILCAVRVAAAITQTELGEGLAVGIDGLARLGVRLPTSPDDPATGAELAAVEANLRGREPAELLDAPAMTSPIGLATMQLLADTLLGAHILRPWLAAFIIARRVNLSLELGHAKSSARAYCEYGVLVQRMTGDAERAHAFGRLAVELVRRAGDEGERSRVDIVFAGSLCCWREPVRTAIAMLRESQKRGLQSGEWLFGISAGVGRVVLLFHQGAELGRLLSEIDAVLGLAKQTNVKADTPRLGSYRNAIRRLQGLSFVSDMPDNATHRETVHLVAAYVLGDYREACRLSDWIGETLLGATRFTEPVEHVYFSALAFAASCDEEGIDRDAFLARIAHHARQLGAWAEHCPENFRHRWLLVAAEQARLEGEIDEAAALYDQAIDEAARAEFLLDEAIAHERYGRFCRGLGRKRTSAWALSSAVALYARWGARAKADALEAEFPDLLTFAGGRRPDTGSDEQGAAGVDQQSLFRAAETIAGEVVLDRLLDALMRLCLATAGASRGGLVIEENGEPYVRAIGSVGESVLVQRTALAAASEIASVAIAKVRESRAPLVLADAAADPRFASDPYISTHGVRSLLVLPILRIGKLVGVLCLENNLATHAFTPERIRILQLLSSQIAISLENSLLFENLKHEIDERLQAERRLRFLAESGEALVQSLDLETTLTKVARLAVSFLADWCTIDLLDGTTLRRAVAAHRDPDKEALIIESRRRLQAQGPPTTVGVLQTGKPVLFTEVTDDVLCRMVPDPEARELIRQVGTRTGMIVPLGGPGRCLGAMAFVSGRRDRSYGAEDLALAEELARRAALAIENARLYRETREAVRQRDEFLSMASHELNTPIAVLNLTIANMNVALGSGAAAGKPLSHHVSVAERQSRRLTRIVGDLLDVTQIDAGALSLTRERVELGEIVRRAADSLATELTRSGSRLSIEGDGEIVGLWDRGRIEQVVRNLLSNASKFAPKKTIELSMERVGENAQFAVRDHGPGLTPGTEARLFDRFARGVSAEHYGGLGLGLYLSRRFVEAHGGSISVSNEPGHGATFVVSLPCTPGSPG